MPLETLAVHAGSRVDPATGAVAPPLYLPTTFERNADGTYPRGYVYVRHGNPNREALEEAMAALGAGRWAWPSPSCRPSPRRTTSWSPAISTTAWPACSVRSPRPGASR